MPITLPTLTPGHHTFDLTRESIREFVDSKGGIDSLIAALEMGASFAAMAGKPIDEESLDTALSLIRKMHDEFFNSAEGGELTLSFGAYKYTIRLVK